MSKPFIEEFLYRGIGEDDQSDPPRESAYHVVLGEWTEALGERRLHITPPLTPEQAKAKGFGLDEIGTHLNSTLMIELSRTRQARDDMATERDKVQLVLDGVRVEAAQAMDALHRDLDDSRQETARLQEEIAALKVRVQQLEDGETS